MDIKKYKSLIMLLIGALWIACMALGWTNDFVLAMCLAVVLIYLHLILGSAKNGVVSKKFLFYPLTVWAILWIVAFVLADFFAVKYAGVLPDFTVLGLHPSFSATFILYWIGGMLTLNVGLYFFSDHWLSKDEWNDFIERVKKFKEEKNA